MKPSPEISVERRNEIWQRAQVNGRTDDDLYGRLLEEEYERLRTPEDQKSTTTTTETKPATCRWCEKGDQPKLLDNDGTLISISGQAGTLCHAHEEYWWPCLRYGAELHTQPASAPQPVQADGEWRVDEPVKGKFYVLDAHGEMAAVAANHKYAAQIVSDHRSAAAVPKLVAALNDLLGLVGTNKSMENHDCERFAIWPCYIGDHDACAWRSEAGECPCPCGHAEAIAAAVQGKEQG